MWDRRAQLGFLDYQTAAVAPASATTAPGWGDSLQHCHGWRIPIALSWATDLPKKGWHNAGTRGWYKRVTQVNNDIASQGFCPSDHSLWVSKDQSSEEKIPKTMRPLPKLWLPHYFKRIEVTLLKKVKLDWAFGCVCSCCSRTGTVWLQELSQRGNISAYYCCVAWDQFRPPSKSIFCSTDLCQTLQWVVWYGLLGFWESDCNLLFVLQRARQDSSEIPLNWQQSTQELSLHSIHTEWLLLKKKFQMICIVSHQASFSAFPLRKTNKQKNNNPKTNKKTLKITLVSPYTLSNMFSYYVYKIRKLCPFLHYWVINLSSLSGSPVKPSSKMNYSCRQQSGACMSLSFYVRICIYIYIHTNKSTWVCSVHVSIHITYSLFSGKWNGTHTEYKG